MKAALSCLVVVATLGLAPSAFAGPCGLPDGQPLWIDFGAGDVESVMARPGTILAVSTGEFPARVRAQGAKTIYWDMNLKGRVGTPTAPADPAVIEERAHRLFVFAASQTQCATPWIAFNELFGARLETPWTPNNAQYRANVLAFLRALARRGARPFLLISSPAYTGPEAAAWWRSVAEVSDIVREVYFSAPTVYSRGAVRGNRHVRGAFRRAVANLVSMGIPVSRVGIMLGFHSKPGTGGREDLQPREAWFETIKWQAMAAREIAAEMNIATVWSWGWGTFSEEGRDADKRAAACVYLWARSPSLCNAPAMAGKRFNKNRGEGRLNLPAGAQCRIGRNTISTTAIARLRLLVQDRDVAYTALFARLAESHGATVTRKEVAAAERSVIAARFGGSRDLYRAALAKAGASVEVARGALADELRRRKLAARIGVARPPSSAVSAFYFSYPDLLVRPVQAEERPAWLGGRTRGLALAGIAPAQLFEAPTGRWTTIHSLSGRFAIRPLDEPLALAAVPLPQARAAIAGALTRYARRDAVERWSVKRQEQLLNEAVCRRDDLPMAATVDLLRFLPFLDLAA